MKKNILKISALAAMMVFGACTKIESDIIEVQPEAQTEGIRIIATDNGTKTSIDSQWNVRWSNGDRIGIATLTDEAEFMVEGKLATGSYWNFPYILEGNGNVRKGTFVFDKEQIESEHRVTDAGKAIQSFTGKVKWSIVSALVNKKATFLAYYPYSTSKKSQVNPNSTQVILPFEQRQTAANNMDHIANYDFTYAKFELPLPEGVKFGDYMDADVTLNFRHAFSLMEYNVLNSSKDTVTVSNIFMDAVDKNIAGDMIIKLETGELTEGKLLDEKGAPMVAGNMFPKVNLVLDKPVVLFPGKSFKAYMLIKPVDLSAKTAKFTVMTDKGEQTFVGGTKFEANKRYRKTLEFTGAEKSEYALHVIDFEKGAMFAKALAGPTAYGDNLYSSFKADKTVDGVTYTNVYQYYLSGKETMGEPNISDDDYYMSLVPAAEMFNGGTYLSRWNDKETATFSNQCSVYSGDHNKKNGGYDHSATFVVAFVGNPSYGGINPSLKMYAPTVIDHLYVNNSTFGVLAMMNGAAPARKLDYAHKDYLKVSFIGLNKGKTTGVVEYYLADFRTAGAPGILKEWAKVNLSPLGAVTELKMTIEGSDSGQWGLNTPAYFCLDNVTFRVAK